MKFCSLTKELCRFVKDHKDYPALGRGVVICNHQAMTGAEKPYRIDKMAACPLKEDK